MKDIHELFTHFKEEFPLVDSKYEELGRTIHEESGPLQEKNRWLIKVAISAAARHFKSLEVHLSKAKEAGATAEEIKSTLKDQQEISLTVYNQNLALIRDVRKVPFNKGLNKIAVREVSAQIRPETAIITNLSNPNSLSLLEQNFDYDLLTPQQLLQK